MSKEGTIIGKCLCWHAWHDEICSVCDYEARVTDIGAFKPAHEVPTRLRLLQPVRGNLPVAVLATAMACFKAERTSRSLFQEAVDAHKMALFTHASEIEALHAKECGCKEWNGTELVFPQEAQP